jgi:hypothetical protein
MINEEILGGLKIALERGQSLESAMNSFFNAGYNRAEIEESARALSEQAPIPQRTFETSSGKTAVASVPSPAPSPETQTNQKVSAYGEKKPKSNAKIFIIIFSILAALIGIGVLLLFLFVL